MFRKYVVTWVTEDGDRFLSHSASFRSVEDAEAAARLITCMNGKDVRVSKADKQVRFSVNNSGEVVMVRTA